MGQEITTPDGKGEVISADYLKNLRESSSADYVFMVQSMLGKDYGRKYFKVTVRLYDRRGDAAVQSYHSWEVSFETEQRDDDTPPWR
jgi:hypothetical protein